MGWQDKMAGSNPQPAYPPGSMGDISRTSLIDLNATPQPGPVISTEPADTKWSDRLRMSVIKDSQTAVRALAESRGIPQDQIANHFHIDESGAIYSRGKDGEFHQEGTGFWKTLGAELMTNLPGMALTAATTAGGVSLPIPGGAYAGAAIGAAGSEGYKNVLTSFLYDEPNTSTGNAIGMGKEAAFALGGEMVGAKIGKAINKSRVQRTVRDFDRLNQVAVNTMTQLSEKYGIQLTPGEMSGMKSLIGRQWQLANYPNSADIIADFMKNREPAIQKAVYDYIGGVAEASDSYSAAIRARGSVQNAKLAMENARRSATDSLYKESFAGNTQVDVSGIINDLQSGMSNYSSAQKKTVEKIIKELSGDTQPGSFINEKALYENKPKIMTLEKLHNIKVSILNKALDRLDDPFAKSAERMDKAILTGAKSKIDTALLNADQTGKYAAAQAKYEELSQPINKLKNSILSGFLDKNDRRVVRAAKTLFGKESSVQSIHESRKIISAIDPAGWDGIVKGHLLDTFNSLADSANVDLVQNVGGQFRKALFNTPNKKAMLKAAMTKEQYQGLEDLMTVLDATSKSFKGQSHTPTMLIANKQFGEEAIADKAGIGNTALKAVTLVLSPKQKFSEWFTDKSFDDYALKMANIITDKNGLDLLRKNTSLLAQAKPGTEKYARLIMRSLGTILGDQADTPNIADPRM